MTAAAPGEALGRRLSRAPAPPALRVGNVGKAFWTRNQPVDLLRAVDFEVAPGELVCLFGPRGAGSSMLLSMIAGLESITHGRIWSQGRPVHGVGRDRALLFSETGLFPWLD